MTPTQIQMFERLSGWLTKAHFEERHEGYVTIEQDAKTGNRDAFLWTADGNNHHVRKMWAFGHIFLK